MLTNQEIKMPVLIEDLGMFYATEKSVRKKRYGLYECYCGNEFKCFTDNIKNKTTKSCGCYSKIRTIESHTTHGASRHRIYQTWCDMIKRCTKNKSGCYKNYGGRGIKVCDRWLNVVNFIEDMYPTYQEGLTIDRINNDGNYEPSNCRWASTTTQARNTQILRRDNTSGYRGVCLIKSKNKWKSTIGINSKIKHLGYYHTAIEAAQAYDNYVILHNLEHTKNFS